MEKHLPFLKRTVNILLDSIIKFDRREESVTKWCSPNSLSEILNTDLPDMPQSEEELLRLIKTTIEYSVKTGHPYFMNQLFSGLDPYGLAGQWITDSLNCSVYTYEVAPVFTIMEKNIIKKMRLLIGWMNGDGIFCPGGSIANGIGLNLARFSYNNKIKYKGVTSLPRLVIFTSCDAHYSIKKMAALLGMGEDNVILIDIDNTGSMKITHLEECIQQCLSEGDAIPIAVFATAGTTVLGAFDPLMDIADLCQKYKLWLHVDAAWGGSLIFSQYHSKKLCGINRADSVTINPHKLLAVPQQCSLLLTRHVDILSNCHATHATYLFQLDKFYDTRLDCGDSHIQCGRRPDVFKFWLMWKAKGSKGFQSHVDSILNISDYMKNCIIKRKNFILVTEPQFVNICFWFIPPSLGEVENVEMLSADFKEKLHKVAPRIKEKMIRKGSLMINYQPHGDKPNFFRFVTQNSLLNESDVEYVLNEIELLGSDL